MSKRRYDTVKSPGDVVGMPKMIMKTERSHEENQERAYIAASRRNDRSLEARVQSAKMASEIHKKRTGKGFKISEEIVSKEEMYEEEDDGYPKYLRNLGSHLDQQKSQLGDRVNMFLATQLEMHNMARSANINKEFSEAFPGFDNANQQMSRRTQSMLLQQQPRQSPSQQSPTFGSRSPSIQSPTYSMNNFTLQGVDRDFINSKRRRTSQASGAMSPPMQPGSPMTRPTTRGSFGGNLAYQRRGSFEPSVLTPTGHSSHTRSTSISSTYSTPTLSSPCLDVGPSRRPNPFTSELPPEMAQFINPDDPNDYLTKRLLMGGGGEMAGADVGGLHFAFSSLDSPTIGFGGQQMPLISSARPTPTMPTMVDDQQTPGLGPPMYRPGSQIAAEDTLESDYFSSTTLGAPHTHVLDATDDEALGQTPTPSSQQSNQSNPFPWSQYVHDEDHVNFANFHLVNNHFDSSGENNDAAVGEE